MVDPSHAQLSVRSQCELLNLHRSGVYYEPLGESAENLALMRLIDEYHLNYPFAGSRMIRDHLRLEGHEVNRKRIQRLMRLMGIEAIYPKKSLSQANKDHMVYPYLLRGVKVLHPNQVWSTDITYVPMRLGFLYLVAVIDWFSRFVLSWRLSNSLSNEFCLEAVEQAMSLFGKPEIFNTDQGSQFTANNFISLLADNTIKISMDGKGRALDNVYIERLWRSVKYEHLYLHDYESGKSLYDGLTCYFEFYNGKRPHSSLAGRPPAEVYTD